MDPMNTNQRKRNGILATVVMFLLGVAVVLSINGCSSMISERRTPDNAVLPSAREFVREHPDEYMLCRWCGGMGIVKRSSGSDYDRDTCGGKGYVRK